MGSSILAYIVPKLAGVHANFIMILTYVPVELWGVVTYRKKCAQLLQIVERPLVVINYMVFMNYIVEFSFTR